ncbi:kinase-like protein [Cucurbitaria berberidis CBS 394.84]|uniref:Kinase-like protein n=1 Tax=Cucurbitaria berberidis CBS 394.84 TaxID=1168544 RepID=A0A9P4GK20_9PLEO|nr:kinase-like protein [Cucurbitaria berberidis CBS 394.84]KAF1846869.1 kinase-like protein [Cucurbitaria berberidis CBS 394.84]
MNSQSFYAQTFASYHIRYADIADLLWELFEKKDFKIEEEIDALRSHEDDGFGNNVVPEILAEVPSATESMLSGHKILKILGSPSLPFPGGKIIEHIDLLANEELGAYGLFSQKDLVGLGMSSEVYSVDARIYLRSTILAERTPPTQKVAVKRLSPKATKKQFVAEYEAFCKTQPFQHPNIVQLLGACTTGRIMNFLFPLALGNLKYLLRGTGPWEEPHVLRNSQTLWGQMEGLASALEFLHDGCKTVHRDIKPSNILLYSDSTCPYIQAKIADFGLALNLEGTTTHTLGTLEAISAWEYDAPEVRQEVKKAQADPSLVVDPTGLVQGDVWKFGSVMVELMTFLIHGSPGVKEFRQFITTVDGNLTSDEIAATRLDDGEKVKPEVLTWLHWLGRDSPRAVEIAPLLETMLGGASSRPDMKTVAETLRRSNCVFWDGARAVRFIQSADTPQPSIVDNWKARLENRLQSRIDWWPLRHGTRLCLPQTVRIMWTWSGRELSLDIGEAKAREYMKSCVPLKDPSTPTVPSRAYTPGSHSAGQSQAMSPKPSPPGSSSGTSSLQPPGSYPLITITTKPPNPSNGLRELYWCVEQPWLTLKTIRRSVTHENCLHNDQSLIQNLRREYDRIRGWKGRIFSWKTCQNVEFVKFFNHVPHQDIVEVIEHGLPKPTDYEYKIVHDEAIHRKMAARQICDGMANAENIRGDFTVLMLPKHVKHIDNWEGGTQAWGMYAVPDWALWKFLIWFGALTTLGLGFIVFWLVFISKTDLQNAFVPAMYITAMVMIALGIPQMRGRA